MKKNQPSLLKRAGLEKQRLGPINIDELIKFLTF